MDLSKLNAPDLEVCMVRVGPPPLHASNIVTVERTTLGSEVWAVRMAGQQLELSDIGGWDDIVTGSHLTAAYLNSHRFGSFEEAVRRARRAVDPGRTHVTADRGRSVEPDAASEPEPPTTVDVLERIACAIERLAECAEHTRRRETT